MRKFILNFILGLTLSVLLSACNLPASTPNAAATLQSVYTSQASTVQVLQTLAMRPLVTVTPLATLNFPTLPPATLIPTNTQTPPPSLTPMLPHPFTVTPTKTKTPVPTNTVISYCNWAAYVKDVSYSDGALVAPGTQFMKTWRLKNVGSCTWKKTYGLVFVKGNGMNGIANNHMPTEVEPGKTVDISVVLTAPSDEGLYTGYWMLRDADGQLFGLGETASDPFYVNIRVTDNFKTIVNFSNNYCDATWRSGAGVLDCPTEKGNKGTVTIVTNPRLEDGQVYPGQGLYVTPQLATNGYIQGTFPAIKIQKGDRFRAVVNCAYQAKGCSAIFRLDYQISNNPVVTFWKFSEAYDGLFYTVDLDLSTLSGKSVKFILTVLSNGGAKYDKLIWVEPRIERP